MTKVNQKYVVLHSGNRDGYKVAEALFTANKLQFLVTDDYIFRFLLKKQNSIPLTHIKTSWLAVFWLVLYKIFQKQSFQIYKDNALSVKGASVANKYQTALIAYSYYALPAFDRLNPALKKILFQLHPHPTYIQKLYQEEIEALPEAKFSLAQEHELQHSLHLEQLKEEAHRADLIFCASSFTKKTLDFDRVLAPVHVVPYGVTLSKFEYQPRVFKEDHLRVIFVGSINQRKGIYYLLAAIKQLQNENYPIHLDIFGRGILDVNLVESFQLAHCTIHIAASFEELLSGYHQSDVFILPSICEGFGQVILEAMATGLPVIATDNTSLPDLISSPSEGVVVPIRDITAIVDQLKFMYHHPSLRLEMGKQSHQIAQHYTWQAFQQQFLQKLMAYE